MSARDDDLLRDVTREVLAELLPGLLEDALAAAHSNGNGNGHRAEPRAAIPSDGDGVVPQVPAPPIAAVHRPSGWTAPAPAESPAPVPAVDDVVPEHVSLRSDADLDAFVRLLARRLENPRDREAILSGKMRFRLAAASVERGATAVAVVRIERGAATERAVKEAAQAGARLVLSSRAVLTPMARDRARSLGVEIEKERPC
jgi:hypothetical protein